MTTKYRIDTWCECVDKTKADKIYDWLVSQLQTQKSDGNITTGNVTKNEIPIFESVSQGI